MKAEHYCLTHLRRCQWGCCRVIIQEPSSADVSLRYRFFQNISQLSINGRDFSMQTPQDLVFPSTGPFFRPWPEVGSVRLLCYVHGFLIQVVESELTAPDLKPPWKRTWCCGRSGLVYHLPDPSLPWWPCQTRWNVLLMVTSETFEVLLKLQRSCFQLPILCSPRFDSWQFQRGPSIMRDDPVWSIINILIIS